MPSTPVIDVVYKATVPMKTPLKSLVAALQKQITRDVKPVWGVNCKLRISSKVHSNNWGLVFLNDSDEANALGYHDVTKNNLPIGRIFVRTSNKLKEDVGVTASHELMEMLLDPALNLTVTRYGTSTIYAYEISDAVEETTYRINGIRVSNFVYPAWFEEFHKAGSAQFDHLKKTHRPFQILKGGYMPVFKNGEWSQIFGSKEKARRFALEIRDGHRNERRRERFKQIVTGKS